MPSSLLQASTRSFLSSFKTLIPLPTSPQPNKSYYFLSLRHFCLNNLSQTPQISPVESNILRILRNKIEDQFEFAPPVQPVKKYSEFKVEDNPGERWITLRGISSKGESVKIIVSMIGGPYYVPNSGEENTGGGDLKLRMDLLVDISKGEGEEDDIFEFHCSAWPDSLEIHRVYIFKLDEQIRYLYMGPNLKDKVELGSGLYEFLKARLVNDDLAVFLHEYMANKDKMEYIEWLKKVKKFIES